MHMPEAEYCDDCHRMVGIACVCKLTFKEKLGHTSFRMGDWAPSKPASWKPPKQKDDE